MVQSSFMSCWQRSPVLFASRVNGNELTEVLLKLRQLSYFRDAPRGGEEGGRRTARQSKAKGSYDFV
jgi:hypothetical protein